MIRPATLDDVPAVAALERAIFGVDAWSSAQVAEELTAPGRRAWVCGDVEGYVVVREGDVVVREGDVLDLLRIAVSPSQRRRGIATALLETAAAEGRMLLEVSGDNKAAIAFYEAEGFVELNRRRRYYRTGADAIVMERAS